MHELRSGLFFFGLSLLVLWESFRVELGTLKEPGSGFLSLCAGLGVGALSLVLIYRGWRVREPGKPHSHRVTFALISLFIYSFVLDSIGFVVATFFLVGILFRLGQPRPWWFLIGVSALVTFLSYLIFGVFLHVYFPRGFLGI
ncbi:MAG: tripartite tricarboxylate transporter TctB family protein [Deltaproteobacteria bacterium]